MVQITLPAPAEAHTHKRRFKSHFPWLEYSRPFSFDLTADVRFHYERKWFHHSLEANVEAHIAHKNDIITGTFGSYDFPISFYILSQNDLNALQKNCHLSANASPVFIEENMAGTGIPYRTIPLPDNATYYFVFLYRGSASPVQLTSSYDTVTLNYPDSLTVTAPANATVLQFPSSSSR